MNPDNSSKGIILGRIRKALIKKRALPDHVAENNLQSIYRAENESLDVVFAKNFTELQGKFVYCENHQQLIDKLKQLSEARKWNHLFCWDLKLQELFVMHQFKKMRIGRSLDKADAGITSCECLIARTGTVLLSSAGESGRALSIFPAVHIVIAKASQIVFDIEDALEMLTKKYDGHLPSMINLETGPSRTADIEKTLVLGAHGPKEVYVFLIDNQ